MIKLGLLLTMGATCSLISCTTLAGQGFGVGPDEGRILISADAEGMRAFSDMQSGLVNEAKTSPDVKSSHYQLREHQEHQRTLRFTFKPKSNGGAK